MGAILYVETNFAVGIAKGQDPDAARFLEIGIPDVALVFPGVCFIEAFSTLSFDIKQKRRLYEAFRGHAREVKRDQTSPVAAGLAEGFEQAIVDGEILLEEIDDRLKDVLSRISGEANEIIAVGHDIIQECSRAAYLDDPTDNLILCCVLWHARQHPDDLRAFFSANHKDFGQSTAVEALKAAGVRYFKGINAAVGWLRSQPSIDPGAAPPTE